MTPRLFFFFFFFLDFPPLAGTTASVGKTLIKKLSRGDVCLGIRIDCLEKKYIGAGIKEGHWLEESNR